MINLSTPNEELIKELRTDFNRVRLWFSEKHLTKKKIRQLAYILERKCIDENLKYTTSEPVEYITKSGNRWIVYLKAEKHGEKTIIHQLQAFCYYETYGSIGAFVPVFNGKSIDKCTIFSSHFFLRMKQRLGLGMLNKSVLKRFIEYISLLHSEDKGKGSHGEHEAEVYLYGAVGRGIFRDESCNILEVKTFLTESELSKSQLWKLQKLKNFATNYISMEHEIIRQRLDNGESVSVHKDYEKNMELIGCDPDTFDKNLWVNGTIIYVAVYYNLSLKNKGIAQWTKNNVYKYQSINEMLEGFGWECNDMEFSKLVEDAVRELTGTNEPFDDYFHVFKYGSEFVKNRVVSEMNERRSKY